jgi:signal transduction histidine kinase
LKRFVGSPTVRRSVRLASLGERIEALFRGSLGARQLDIDVADTATLHCDPDKVMQMLVNLVSNAVEATNEGEEVGLALVPTETGADIVVWDTGPGFVAEPATLFAPWFTTKPRGTGLGLTITHRLVRSHGWTIRAARSGRETHFVIAIPSTDISGTVSASRERERAL